MKKNILILLITIGCLIPGFSQDKEWLQFSDSTVYFPKQKVDSILILSSNRTRESISDTNISADWHFLKSEVELYSYEEKTVFRKRLDSIFDTPDFPLNDYSLYLELFEKQCTVEDKSEISELVGLFPIKECSTTLIARCPPKYRDVIIFFYKKKAIGALKICLSCTHISSTPHEEYDYCMTNNQSAIVKKWMEMGLLKLW